MAFTNAIHRIPPQLVNQIPRDYMFREYNSRMNLTQRGNPQTITSFTPESLGFLRQNAGCAVDLAALGLISELCDPDKSPITDSNNVAITGSAILDICFRKNCLDSRDPEIAARFPITTFISKFIYNEHVMGQIHAYYREDPIHAMEEGTIYSRGGEVGGYTYSRQYGLSRYFISSNAEPLLTLLGDPVHLKARLQIVYDRMAAAIEAQNTKLAHYAMCGGIPVHHEEHQDQARLATDPYVNPKQYLHRASESFLWAHDRGRTEDVMKFFDTCITSTTRKEQILRNSTSEKKYYVMCPPRTMQLYHAATGNHLKQSQESNLITFSNDLFFKNGQDLLLRGDSAILYNDPFRIKEKTKIYCMQQSEADTSAVVALNNSYTTKQNMIDHEDNPELFRAVVPLHVECGVLKEGCENACQKAHDNVNMTRTIYYDPAYGKQLSVNEWDCNKLFSVSQQFDMVSNRQNMMRTLGAKQGNASITGGFGSGFDFTQKINSLTWKNREHHNLAVLLNNPKGRPFMVMRRYRPDDLHRELHYKLNTVVGGSNNAMHPPEMLHAITKSYFKAYGQSTSTLADEFRELLTAHASIDISAKKSIIKVWKLMKLVISGIERENENENVGNDVILKYTEQLVETINILASKYKMGWALCNPIMFYMLVNIEIFIPGFYNNNKFNDKIREQFMRLNAVAMQLSKMRKSMQDRDQKAISGYLSNFDGIRNKVDTFTQYHLYTHVLDQLRKNPSSGAVHFPMHYQLPFKQWDECKHHMLPDILFYEMVVLPTFANRVELCCNNALLSKMTDRPLMTPRTEPITLTSNSCSYTSKEEDLTWDAIHNNRRKTDFFKLSHATQICRFMGSGGTSISSLNENGFVIYTQNTSSAGNSQLLNVNVNKKKTTGDGYEDTTTVYVAKDVTSVIPGIRTIHTPRGFGSPRELTDANSVKTDFLQQTTDDSNNVIAYRLDYNASFHLGPAYDDKVEYIRQTGENSDIGKGFNVYDKIFAHYMCLYLNTSLTWSVPRNFKFWFGYDVYPIALGSFEMSFAYNTHSIVQFIGASLQNVEDGGQVTTVTTSIPMGMMPISPDPVVYSSVSACIGLEYINDDIFTTHDVVSKSQRAGKAPLVDLKRIGDGFKNCLNRAIVVPTFGYRKTGTLGCSSENFIHMLGRAGPYFDHCCKANRHMVHANVAPSTEAPLYNHHDLTHEDPTNPGTYFTNPYAFYSGCAGLMYDNRNAGDKNEIISCGQWDSQSKPRGLKNAIDIYSKGSEQVNKMHTDWYKVYEMVDSFYPFFNGTMALNLKHTMDCSSAYGSGRVSVMPGVQQSGGDNSTSRVCDSDTAKLITHFDGGSIPNQIPITSSYSRIGGQKLVRPPVAVS